MKKMKINLRLQMSKNNLYKIKDLQEITKIPHRVLTQINKNEEIESIKLKYFIELTKVFKCTLNELFEEA